MQTVRHKYRFSGPTGRKDAEATLARIERERMYLYWYAVALDEGRIHWTERNTEGYRFATFVAVPGRDFCNRLLVSEFRRVHMPSLHVMDEDMLREELATHARFGDWWFAEGVEAARKEVAA